MCLHTGCSVHFHPSPFYRPSFRGFQKIDFFFSPCMPGMTRHCCNHHVTPVVCVWSRATELNRWVLGPRVPGPVFIVCPLHALFGKSWIVHLDLIPQIDTFTAGRKPCNLDSAMKKLFGSSKSYSITWQLLTGRKHPKSQGLIYKWVMWSRALCLL